MNTIPIHQAVKFYDNQEDYFNNTEDCVCDEMNEKWEYILKPGDITEVQVIRECTPITYGSDIILNGSFEDGTGIDPDNWTINDSEKVIRANDDPFIGQWALRWNNPTGEGSATQDTDVNFLDGEVWLLEFYTKVTNPAISYLTPLEVFVGGLPYLVTPTEDYTKISIPVVFLDNGIDQNIVFYHNSVLPAADFMYVDLVIMRKVTYEDNTCELNLVYNGNFEYGQHKVTGDTPVVATFDGWELDGTVEASITGGFNGTRCPVLYGSGTPASVGQTLPVMGTGNTYQIKFMAKAATDGDEISVTAGISEVSSFTLTSEWVEYTAQYTAADDATELIFTANTNEIYIDDVSIVLINPVNNDSIYVHDIDNDVYYTNDILTQEFDGGYNALFDWEEMIQSDTPGCMQIITEFDDSNVVLNSKFSLGVGNTFTNWTKNEGNGSIVESISGGVSGSRAAQLNRNTNLIDLRQISIMAINTNYTIAFWVKKVSGSPILRVSSNSSVFESIPINNLDFIRVTLRVTTGPTDTGIFFEMTADTSSIILDNIFISQEGTGIHYSDLLKYDKTNTVCAPEIVWYDAENCFDINYESGFKNKIRINDLNFSTPYYPVDEYTKTLNGLVSYISRAVVKKQKNLKVPPVPEFIHDRLAIAMAHSNIEVDEAVYCSTEETIYTPVDSETGCRLSVASALLSIEGEILAKRSINCE